jgi:hypothetical protein
MAAKVLNCLVTIKRAGTVAPRFVPCVQDGGSFLAIPVEEYALPEAQGRSEMMLRVPDSWLVTSEGAAHDLRCLKIIDLDNFDDLPWADLPPIPNGVSRLR